jgi:predicted nucleotidyltransferase
MRLKPYQIEIIRRAVTDLAGDDARVSLFGSQTNDNARGGDIDLLVEVPRPVEEPAWLSARISGRISHSLGGRKIDVVLSAPNLEHFPIHDVAKKEGISL